MLTINFKARLRNKAFWISLISAVVLLIQQLGFKDIIPSNYSDIVNSVLSIFTMLGIIVDTSTQGISDQVMASTNVQAINQTESSTIDDNKISEDNQNSSNDPSMDTDNKTNISTESLDNVEVSSDNKEDTSASSKVIVDNPDNVQSIGAAVNATGAVSPQ